MEELSIKLIKNHLSQYEFPQHLITSQVTEVPQNLVPEIDPVSYEEKFNLTENIRQISSKQLGEVR